MEQINLKKRAQLNSSDPIVHSVRRITIIEIQTNLNYRVAAAPVKTDLTKHLTDVVNVAIATTHVGAFARPSWYGLAFGGRAIRAVLMSTELREQYTDALKVGIKEQELVGLDILTDNKPAYDPYIPAFGWPAFVLERLEGVKMDAHLTRAGRQRIAPIMVDFSEAMPGFKVADKLGRGNLEFAHFFKLSQQYTSKVIKFSVIDPVLISKFVYNEYYKDRNELMFDMAEVYNEEFRDLADAGCRVIQTDVFPPPYYPWASSLPKDMQPSFMQSATDEQVRLEVEAFNEAVKGVGAQIWLHLCWGRPRNQFLFGTAGNFAKGMKILADVKADVIQIEAASTQGANLESELRQWKEYCSDKDVGIGVVNHRTTIVETADEVADLIKKALKFVPPARLCVSTDCGLAAVPRDIAFFKLKSLVEGTKLVRKQLSIE